MAHWGWLTVSGCHAVLIAGFSPKDKPANSRHSRRRAAGESWHCPPTLASRRNPLTKGHPAGPRRFGVHPSVPHCGIRGRWQCQDAPPGCSTASTARKESRAGLELDVWRAGFDKIASSGSSPGSQRSADQFLEVPREDAAIRINGRRPRKLSSPQNRGWFLEMDAADLAVT